MFCIISFLRSDCKTFWVMGQEQVSILNLYFSSSDALEDWKCGSQEDNEHKVSSSFVGVFAWVFPLG